MDTVLVNFAQRLRRIGIPVSPPEIMDGNLALEQVGLDHRRRVKDALRAVMCKRAEDIPAFDAAFDLFFASSRVQEDQDQAQEQGEENQPDYSRAMAELLQIHQPDLSLITQLIMAGRLSELMRLILEQGRDVGLERMESPLQAGFFRRKLRQALDLDVVSAQARDFLSSLAGRSITDSRAESLSLYVEKNIGRVENELQGLIQRELAQNRFLTKKRMAEEDLLDQNLRRINERDLAALRPVVDKLARRLKDRLSIQYRKAERGRLDLKKTLRHNVGYGGVLSDIYFRNKRPHRPQVVALCDVSGSVANFSRFMLLFLYSVKEVISRFRSYIFVGDLCEVTELFNKNNVHQAVNRAAKGEGLRYISRTDYGGALGQFAAEHLGAVNSRTTVFILGDARSNYYDPVPSALKAIREKARKLIWLNPEPRLNWKLGDSVIEVYQPYCTTLSECGNIRQLSNLIEENLMP
jgi:uncharacterized protein with von Willebrand factor type A (vWA) domain